MYIKYLNTLSILFATIGTVKAVFSILKMNLKSILSSRTALQQDTMELSILLQVYEARVGTAFMFLSGMLQILVEWINPISRELFLKIFIGSILAGVIWWALMYVLYRIAKKKLWDNLPPEIKKAYNENRKS